MRHQIMTALIILSGFMLTSSAQDPVHLNDSIEKYRTGIIVVKTSPDAVVELEQLRHEFRFGAAIANQVFDGSMDEKDAQMYKQKFLENFNSAVTENSLKWQVMERQKGMVNFKTTDNILAWTDENNIPLRGHNIYWGISNFVQEWVKELDNEQLYDELHTRARTIAARYKGRFVEYDLNNEMMHGDYYQEKLGPGITREMAEWIKEYDPGAKLYLNDYDILTGRMLQEYVDHIKDLQERGVPIDGIGVQGHLHAEDFIRDTLWYALDVLSRFDLPILITEFNMPGQRSGYYRNRSLVPTREDEEIKARNLVDYYRICFAHPAVDGILMWGFWEGAIWIPASSLYKKDWTPTPAAKAYQSLLFDEWWSRFKGKSDDNGYCIIRAFYGSHKLKVNGFEKTVKLSKENGIAFIESGTLK